jgi:hypothetical protein
MGIDGNRRILMGMMDIDGYGWVSMGSDGNIDGQVDVR